jgi:hypothetical protein
LNPSSFSIFELNGFPFLSEDFKLNQDLELSFKSLQVKLNQVCPFVGQTLLWFLTHEQFHFFLEIL